MTFEEALRALREGKTVKRKGHWSPSSLLIREFSIMDITVESGVRWLRDSAADGALGGVRFDLAPEDISAKDYYVVEQERKPDAPCDAPFVRRHRTEERMEALEQRVAALEQAQPTRDLPEGDTAAPPAPCAADDDAVLCYVDGGFAYFTTRPLEDQWGDDWDDAPYEHNAGEPYPWRGEGCPEYRIVKVAWDGPLHTPAETSASVNSPWSVRDINRGRTPWLTQDVWSLREGALPVRIMAGTTLREFRALVAAAGGSVYERPVGNADQSPCAPQSEEERRAALADYLADLTSVARAVSQDDVLVHIAEEVFDGNTPAFCAGWRSAPKHTQAAYIEQVRAALLATERVLRRKEAATRDADLPSMRRPD